MALCLPTCMTSSIISTFHHNNTLGTINDPTLTHDYCLKSIVYMAYITVSQPGVVYSMTVTNYRYMYLLWCFFQLTGNHGFF